jgi:hypothetical protein
LEKEFEKSFVEKEFELEDMKTVYLVWQNRTYITPAEVILFTFLLLCSYAVRGLPLGLPALVISNMVH